MVILYVDFLFNKIPLTYHDTLNEAMWYCLIYLIFNIWFTKNYYAIYVILKWDNWKSFAVAVGMLVLVFVSWFVLMYL